MAVPNIDYGQMLQYIRAAYEQGLTSWAQVDEALAADASYSLSNYAAYFKSNPAAFKVIENSNASLRSVSTQISSEVLTESPASAINSNLGSSVVSESAYVEVPANMTAEAGATTGRFSAGLNLGSKVATGTRFVFGEVAPAVGAAMTGCALGKTIDGAIYDIGEALNTNPPWALDPSTWGSLTSDIDENDPLYVQWAGKALNFLLGINPDDGTTTAYMDENAVAAYAQWLYQQGVFDSSFSPVSIDVGNYQTSSVLYVTTLGDVFYNNLLPSATSDYTDDVNYNNFFDVTSYTADMPVIIRRTYLSSSSNYLEAYPINSFLTDNLIVNSINDKIANVSARIAVYGFLRIYTSQYVTDGKSRLFTYDRKPKISDLSLSKLYMASNISELLIPNLPSVHNIYFAGKQVTKPGVGDQTDAVLPDTSTWLNPEAIGQYLAQYFPQIDPDWADKKVTQTVPQPDGNPITYTYVPVPMVQFDPTTQTNPSTGPFSQLNPVVQPDLDPQLNPIVNTIPQLIAQPIQPNPDIPTNPSDTGSGETPPVYVPVINPEISTGMWAVYNPSDDALASFGRWLWSSNFVDQIKKLFNNPMDAIIGLHQVYAPVTKGRKENIRCGYIDSNVLSDIVARRYSKSDCGTIYLKEYFGNVFDYDPYTQVSIYLPFIGVVPLKTADVMRARLTVLYHFDVLTGACLAEIQVKRDGAGGVIYTFTGSCAVSLPFSSGSYMNAVVDAAMVGINSIGAIASGFSGNLLAMTMFAGGAIANTFKEHTSVQKSGSFSGNAGAMGGKTPYLIITRPQTELAANYQHFVGIPSNENVVLGSVSGYAKVKSVHVEAVTNASEEEKREIESLLKSGVLIQ